MQQIDLIKLYKNKRALIIDDFPDMRGSIRRMLASTGIESVEVAANGQDAIRKFESGSYNIVLADYNLGDGKNGQQVLEELRYRGILHRTTLYMMITAETNRAMVFGALEYQPDDYLAKPFTQAVLQKRLNRLILEKEALRPIHEAMDKQHWQKAADLARKPIGDENRYESKRLRLLTESLYHAGNFSEAEEAYRQVLARRRLEWAEIGLGKTLVQQGELHEAATIFRNLVNRESKCLEVYDCLAEIENKMGQYEQAQKLLEHASEISPNAILRQQTLARISEENGDLEGAEKARKQSLKLAVHSCYERPECYFELARIIGTRMSLEPEPDSKREKEADDVLRRAERRYDDEQTRLRTQLNRVQLLKNAKKTDEAQQLLNEVNDKIEQLDEVDPKLLLSLAESHMVMEDKSKGSTILQSLAEKYQDHEEIGDAIDRLSEEPLSKKGKQQAINLNQQAKVLFADQNFAQASQIFEQALRVYPNNIALMLNAILASVRMMEADTPSMGALHYCEELFERIGTLPDQHPQAERCRKLRAHVDKLVTQMANAS